RATAAAFRVGRDPLEIHQAGRVRICLPRSRSSGSRHARPGDREMTGDRRMRCDGEMKVLSLVRRRKKLGALLLSLGLLVGATAVFAQAPLADGQVVKIDPAAGKITIKHGPLKQFGMDEGMTMAYRAADPAMLNAVKPGDKVKFAPDRVNGQFTVTKIERAR